MNAITIENLSKTYRDFFGKKKRALNNLTLSIAQGELFGFIGPNGAGKTTTIKLLLNLIKPSSGKALILGKNILTTSSRKKVGYLPENPYYYDFLTPIELLNFAGTTFGISKKILTSRITDLLKLVDLYSVKDITLRKFSKGMVQRSGLAMSMISDPDLLIFDEPASGLDPIGRKLVIDILLNLKKRGKTIFFSSHILHDVETICDRVGVIVNGTLKHEKKISTLISENFEIFDVTAHRINNEKLTIFSKKGFTHIKEGETTKFITEKRDLWRLLECLKNENIHLVSIEPKRKTVEDIFLESISGVRDINQVQESGENEIRYP